MDTADEFDGHSGGNSDAMSRLDDKVNEALEMKSLCEQLDADLKAAKATLHKITSQELPDMMTEMQVDELSRNGRKFKLADFVSGSLPKELEKRAAAIAWLEGNDGGDLIKTSVGVDFGRSEHNLANAVFEDLKSRGLSASINSGVHAQTLASFARERIKKGEQIDTDILGLYTGKVVKITGK